MSNQLTLSQTMANPNVAKFIEDTLGSRKNQFTSDLLSLQESTPALKKMDQVAVIKCAITATALNLPLNKNLGYAYVIPYDTTPQFQIGYKGIIQLAIRSGQYQNINVCEVREGEMKRNKFNGEVEYFEEQPNNEIVGFLATFKLLNGFSQSLYMTNEEIAKHRDKYSKSGKGGKGVWGDNYEHMAKKTVLKLLLNRYGVLSVEMQTAITKDQSDGQGNYVDRNEIVKAEFEEREEVELIEQKEISIENFTAFCEINDLDVLKVTMKYKLNSKSSSEEITSTIEDLNFMLESNDDSINELKATEVVNNG